MDSTSQSGSRIIVKRASDGTLIIPGSGSGMNRILSSIGNRIGRKMDAFAIRAFRWGPEEQSKRIVEILGKEDDLKWSSIEKLYRYSKGEYHDDEKFLNLRRECFDLMEYTLS
jgi:hypothetical protein